MNVSAPFLGVSRGSPLSYDVELLCITFPETIEIPRGPYLLDIISGNKGCFRVGLSTRGLVLSIRYRYLKHRSSVLSSRLDASLMTNNA